MFVKKYPNHVNISKKEKYLDQKMPTYKYLL